jgi:CSLREA domain-containing protein
MNPRAVLPPTSTATRPSLIRPVGGKRARDWALGLLVPALIAACLVLAAEPAQAQTLTVNNTTDPGDGDCNPNGGCTLREAINEANTSTADTIGFRFHGGGVNTISPTSPLPTIRERLTIDGYSQPGASENTAANGTNAVLKIELDGSDAGAGALGIEVQASGCVIKGLVINRFGGHGVRITSIGPETQDNRVVGNFIGTNAAGTQDLGNGGAGVYIDGADTSDNTVGGSRPEPRNLISGNDLGGVEIYTTDNAILGNLIGTEKNGTDELGNSGGGVEILGDASNDNIVGGTLPESANTIAFNSETGVWVDGDNGNGILRNSIFENDGLGIDLAPLGATPNDEDDPDTGSNNLQNKPNLTSAKNSATTTTIKGSLNSVPNRTFRIRFFSNPSGNEGKRYIGAKNVTTNADGDTGSFTFKPENKVGANQNITATATGTTTGNTSEFSGPEEVV